MSPSIRRAGVAALVALLLPFPAAGVAAGAVTDTLWVAGMTMPDCDDIGLELLLASLPGVVGVEVVFESGETTVHYDPAAVDREAIIAEVINRGFSVPWVTDVFVVSGWAVPARDALAVRLLVDSVDGVDQVEVEEASGRTTVRYDPAQLSPEDIVAEIRNLDYEATRHVPAAGVRMGGER